MYANIDITCICNWYTPIAVNFSSLYSNLWQQSEWGRKGLFYFPVWGYTLSCQKKHCWCNSFYQEVERDGCTCFTHFLLLHLVLSKSAVQKTVLLTFRVSFLSSVTPLWQHSHKYTQEHISYMILSLVSLMIKVTISPI